MADELSGEWVSVSVAAKIAHVQPEAIRRWIKKGRLPADKTVGGHRRISVDVLREVIATGPNKRARPLLTDLGDVVDEWVEQLDEFAAWRPPKHLSDDQLARLRVEISGYDGAGGLVGDLRRLADRITAELDARDRSAG